MSVQIITKDPVAGNLMKCGDVIAYIVDWQPEEPNFKGAYLTGGNPNFRVDDCCKMKFNLFRGKVIFDGSTVGAYRPKWTTEEEYRKQVDEERFKKDE